MLYWLNCFFHYEIKMFINVILRGCIRKKLMTLIFKLMYIDIIVDFIEIIYISDFRCCMYDSFGYMSVPHRRVTLLQPQANQSNHCCGAGISSKLIRIREAGRKLIRKIKIVHVNLISCNKIELYTFST